MPFSEAERRDIAARYAAGESPADISNDFPQTVGSIKEMLRRRGVIRTQSESAKLAASQGKKQKAATALIRAAKTSARYHPGKRFAGVKVCEGCNRKYNANSARQRWCKTCCPGPSWQRLAQRYGVTKPNWDTMLAAQAGLCALCDNPPAVVDHDHATGEVRGLLCGACNFKLAGLDDPMWLARAEDYVKRRI